MASLGEIMPRLKKWAQAFLIQMRKKRMEDKDKRLDLDTPEEGVVSEEVSEAVVEETPTDEVVSDPEDRSAYNCPDCNGDGLLATGLVCGKCAGSGKV